MLDKQPFLDVMEEDTVVLAQHPFGNYALQVAIDAWELEECLNIINTVLEYLPQLSMQKFSSNVVEKCKFFNEINVKALINLLMKWFANSLVS